MIKMANVAALPAKLDDLSQEAFLAEFGDSLIQDPKTGQGVRLRDLPALGYGDVFQKFYNKWRAHKAAKNTQTVVHEVSKAEGIPPRQTKGLLAAILGDWAEDPRKKKWVKGVLTAIGIGGATALGLAYAQGRQKDKAMDDIQRQLEKAIPPGGAVKQVMDKALKTVVENKAEILEKAAPVQEAVKEVLPLSERFPEGVIPLAEGATGLIGDAFESIPSAPGEKIVSLADKLKKTVSQAPRWEDVVAPTIPKIDVPSGWGQAVQPIIKDMGGFNPMRQASVRVAMRYLLKKK